MLLSTGADEVLVVASVVHVLPVQTVKQVLLHELRGNEVFQSKYKTKPHVAMTTWSSTEEKLDLEQSYLFAY